MAELITELAQAKLLVVAAALERLEETEYPFKQVLLLNLRLALVAQDYPAVLAALLPLTQAVVVVVQQQLLAYQGLVELVVVALEVSVVALLALLARQILVAVAVVAPVPAAPAS